MKDSYLKIKSYQDFLPEKLYRKLLAQAKPIPSQAKIRYLISENTDGSYESPLALQFVGELYEKMESALLKILEQRKFDRDFLDQRTAALYRYNQEQGIDISDPRYETVIGLEDSQGRIVIGPKSQAYNQAHHKDSFEGNAKAQNKTDRQDTFSGAVAPIPDYLQGPHVTLFGPPDSAKMTINAMNSYHRKLKEEPPIVSEILSLESIAPFWGADDEDSKTPLHEDLLSAGQNLSLALKGHFSM